MTRWACFTFGDPKSPPTPEQPRFLLSTAGETRGRILTQTCMHQLYRDDDDYMPLVATPATDPPIGQVRLFEPIKLPTDDAEYASWLRSELEARRAEMEFAVATEDWLILDVQATEFGALARRLLWQRFRFRLDSGGGMITPLGTREVVAEAQRLRDRCGRVMLQATGAESFQLLGPRQLGRGASDCVRASLEPVFQALAAKGLWVATDNQLEGLARTLIRMARRSGAGASNDGAHQTGAGLSD